jgi:uncharacterized protein (DUF2342 family)
MTNAIHESAFAASREAARHREFMAGYITALEQRIRALENIMIPLNVDTTIVDRLLQIEQRVDDFERTVDNSVDTQLYHYFQNHSFKVRPD